MAIQTRIKSINDRQMRNFKDKVLREVRFAENETMSNVASIMVKKAVQQAEFADYSGALANSYQVGVFEDGQFKRILSTSLGKEGTSKIIPYKQGEKMKARKQRRGSAEYFTKKENNTPKSGYGRRITLIKGLNIRSKNGVVAVLANPTPYAPYVQEHWHRVFPSDFANDIKPFMIKILGSTIIKHVKNNMHGE